MANRLSFVAFLLSIPLLLLARPAAAQQYVGPTCQYQHIRDAIGKVPSPQTIYVAPGIYTENPSIQDGDSLTIIGGYTQGCAAGLSGATIIDGSSTARSVLYIGGRSNVKLSNLVIKGGASGPGGYGGGINFFGYGALTLESVELTGNTADFGGGLSVLPVSDATVTLSGHALIHDNTATQDGGGIYIDGSNGSARLFMFGAQSAIYMNHAPNGNGGGINMVGPARVDIGAGLDAIHRNDAMYGGGISAVSQVHGSAVVRLFATDRQQPVTLWGNTASVIGGGVYLKPFNNGTFRNAHAALCAYNFQMTGNVAVNGAAIYADVDQSFNGTSLLGSQVFLNTDDGAGLCNPEPASDLGAVAVCADGASCNLIKFNRAQDPAGNVTNGSTIMMQDGGRFQADRIFLFKNAGGSALTALDNGSGNSTVMTNCLFAENQVSNELITGIHNFSHSMSLDHCTLAGDTIGAADVIHTQSRFTLNNSIVAEGSKSTLSYAGPLGGLSLNYVLANDASTLQGCNGCLQGDPQFVRVGTLSSYGDYHLQSTSPALDFAPPPAFGNLDLDGKPRNVDLPNVPNNGQLTADLGAYELPIDQIFKNGFD